MSRTLVYSGTVRFGPHRSCGTQRGGVLYRQDLRTQGNNDKAFEHGIPSTLERLLAKDDTWEPYKAVGKTQAFVDYCYANRLTSLVNKALRG